VPGVVGPITVAYDATALLGRRTGVGATVAGWLASVGAEEGITLRPYGLTATGWRALRHQLPPAVPAGRGPMPAGVLLRMWEKGRWPPVQWWTGTVDVVHGTNFVVPPARRAPRLVTVHDLTPLRLPQMCTPTALRYPGLIHRAVGDGAHVHTVSSTMATEIIDAFDIDAGRVHVISPGVTQPGAGAAVVSADGGAGSPDGGREGDADRVRYVLALGTVEPRKDLPGLVAAWDRIAGGHPHLQLVLAGVDGWGAQALTVAIAGARHRDRIRRLGWVTDRTALLAGAAVFAYPSVYEGFGLPPLEAMAAGVPVVATAGGAVPEVVGDAAVVVPVGDVDALAAALEQVLTDPGLQARLVAAGTGRVARYRWEDSGAAMAALYRDLAAGRS